MLNLIMGPVRHNFSSIDAKLAQHPPRKDSITMPDSERSAKKAEEAAQNFSKAELNPITSNEQSTSKPGVTFAAQEKLPKLPIPDLEQTAQLARY